jgi:hypothetical protein
MVMVLKLELKKCANLASTTYHDPINLQSLRPNSSFLNRFQTLPGKENE